MGCFMLVFSIIKVSQVTLEVYADHSSLFPILKCRKILNTKNSSTVPYFFVAALCVAHFLRSF